MVFICCFFKVFTENIYKVEVTQIFNLFLLLSAQTCCQKWLSKCWKCHFRHARTKTFSVACPGPPRRLGLCDRPPPLSTILDPPLRVRGLYEKVFALCENTEGNKDTGVLDLIRHCQLPKCSFSMSRRITRCAVYI